MPVGESAVLREGTDVTLISFGRMGSSRRRLPTRCRPRRVSRPRSSISARIRPLDFVPVFESVRKTHRAVVIRSSGNPLASRRDCASITENCFDDLDSEVIRVTGEDVPMPYARNLELLAVPDEARVRAGIERALYRS